MSYMIPVLLVVQVVLLIILLFKKEFFIVVLLLVLGVSCAKPFRETISLNLGLLKPKASEESKARQLRVFSFNASTFNPKRQVFAKQDSTFIDNLLDYLKSDCNQIDVLCFQEFHHDDWERRKLIEELVQSCQTKYYYMAPFWRNYQNGIFGLIILSKHPIVDKGLIFSDGPYSFNKGIFADIKYGDDTIKIVNVHLQSMSIRFKGNTEDQGVKGKFSNIFQKLRMGAEKRKNQVDTLENTIFESKHPMILCGDLNSFPYGYSYQKIKSYLYNSFEEAGSGFGFTLNIAPYWVRVDNQFCSKDFRPISSKVVKEIDRSDHFPILSSYIYDPQ